MAMIKRVISSDVFDLKIDEQVLAQKPNVCAPAIDAAKFK